MSTISVHDVQSDLLAFLRRGEAGAAFLEIVAGAGVTTRIAPVIPDVSLIPRDFGLSLTRTCT